MCTHTREHYKKLCWIRAALNGAAATAWAIPTVIRVNILPVLQKISYKKIIKENSKLNYSEDHPRRSGTRVRLYIGTRCAGRSKYTRARVRCPVHNCCSRTFYIRTYKFQMTFKRKKHALVAQAQTVSHMKCADE